MIDKARLDEIRESIIYMRRRLEDGQGDVTKAMCRLSLSMSEDLLGMVEALLKRLEPTYIKIDKEALEVAAFLRSDKAPRLMEDCKHRAWYTTDPPTCCDCGKVGR